MFASLLLNPLLVTANTLEERVEVLEEIVMEIEDKLVQDYGLVKRCQLQQVENGISVCRFKGIEENESLDNLNRKPKKH